MNTPNLVLVGGGGHCKSVIEAAESAGFKILGILDSSIKNNEILGYPVLGDDSLIADLKEVCQFIVSVGQINNSNVRIKLHQKIKEAGGNLATVIASSAIVSKHAKIGDGTLVLHHALVNASARVGEGCIINSFANIEHDTVIEDYCHISTGAMINGNCHVSRNTFIGSQCVIANGVHICNECVIGAGSLVLENIIKGGLYFGVPVTFRGIIE